MHCFLVQIWHFFKCENNFSAQNELLIFKSGNFEFFLNPPRPFFFLSKFDKWYPDNLSYLPVLVMTISVPYLWNCSQSSLASSVTLGSSWTLSSSGGGGRGGNPPNGSRGKRPGYPYAGLKLLVGPRPGNPGGMEQGPAGEGWRRPERPKSGLGMKGGEKAIVLWLGVQGDIICTPHHWYPTLHF